MKHFIFIMLLTALFSFGKANAQQLITLKNGKSTQINGYTVSYVATLKKTKKAEDYYRVTVSITNTGNDYLVLFPLASVTYVKEQQQPLAFFQFTNATGRGLSSTTGKLYPNPLMVMIPYKCKKCPPPPAKSKEDPYNHYTKSYYIGVQFRHGSIKSRRFEIRVPSGTVPVVKVIVR